MALSPCGQQNHQGYVILLFLLIIDRGEGRREGEGEKERETVRERDINLLFYLLIHSLFESTTLVYWDDAPTS